jgi:transcriptional regulator with XRE-family HTH domain
MPEASRPPSPFGQRLRLWRKRSGVSQLDLALLVGTSPRHISFVETGRSRPGRDLVLRLAEALEVPVRDRNALLVSAGLPPAFADRALDDEAMQPISAVLGRVLAKHEPYPAWVVGRSMRFLASNRGAEALFPGMCSRSPAEIVEMWYAPGPFRDAIENWHEVFWAGLASLRREAAHASPDDGEISTLLARAESYARDVPPPDTTAHELPVVCSRLKLDGRAVRTISAVMRFDSAVEVTASELRVELMFPADRESAAFFRERSIGSGSDAGGW